MTARCPTPVLGRHAVVLAKALGVDVVFGGTLLVSPTRDAATIEEQFAAGHGAMFSLDVGEAGIVVGSRIATAVRRISEIQPHLACTLLDALTKVLESYTGTKSESLASGGVA